MKATNKPKQSVPESTEEYREGFAAARRGQRVTTNPYNAANGESNERTNWYTGWYDANYSRKDEACY